MANEPLEECSTGSDLAFWQDISVQKDVVIAELQAQLAQQTKRVEELEAQLRYEERRKHD